MTSSRPGKWKFWIDRGGTFTDCIGLSPGGHLQTTKVLSSDEAPLLGMRELLGRDPASVPAEVRMGTTVATNALLERRGVSTVLVINEGFGDMLSIGDQTRPSLFELAIKKQQPLHDQVAVSRARQDHTGKLLRPHDEGALRQQLLRAREQGAQSAAIALIHSHRSPSLEGLLAETARDCGFEHVSLSSEVVCEEGLLGRAATTVVDAYLTPLLRDYLKTVQDGLHPQSTLLLMQSSGGLTPASRFRGRNAILSGPAAGVIAYANMAEASGHRQAIGFDMGGTSTDVSCYSGAFERRYENHIAGVSVRAPMMTIHTVAAGGGSVCRLDGERFRVGPESAGARPGPLCYGDPRASELTLTDVNLFLGRLAPDRFPFELVSDVVESSLRSVREEMQGLGFAWDELTIAAGFLRVANANMAAAIREVTVNRGRDPRDHALFVFGGAGGQHACAIARELGIRTLVFDPMSGVLSAMGMALAPITWHGERDAAATKLDSRGVDCLRQYASELSRRGSDTLMREGHDEIELAVSADFRYAGSDHPIEIPLPDLKLNPDELRSLFEERHHKEFGFERPGRLVELATVRVEVRSRPPLDRLQTREGGSQNPQPRRTQRMWTGTQMADVPVYYLEDLGEGFLCQGPALVLDPVGAIVVDTDFELEVHGGRVELHDQLRSASTEATTQLDPVFLEIMANLFMSIATQMGNILSKTAVSTNIRERRDFSCAIFDKEGELVANAPHIPVHLGAMGASVRAVLEAHPNAAPGSAFAVNSPALGGSHLPDITVVSPIHDESGRLVFTVASRGHHADVGGKTPGSMPAFSQRLEEEGVVFECTAIVEDECFNEEAVVAVLASGPFPARTPRDNIADLKAQIAANRAGATLLLELHDKYGSGTVESYMGYVIENAERHVRACLAAIPDGSYQHSDELDDGTVIAVRIEVLGETMSVDFAGTSGACASNTNAPRAVSLAAILYVLRCMVDAPIPLNAGCLRPVSVAIPPGSLLDPPPEAAVSSGNVETSQRVVDVLLGALGLAAASQGTMNNLSFGTEDFGYYETIGGGAGAVNGHPGASGVQVHMTNTRITDPEILEDRFPVYLREFSLRRGSGGAGAFRGGDGLVRELEFRADMELSLVGESRSRAPFGLEGGSDGACGQDHLNGKPIAGRSAISVKKGDRLRIETPGGGGFGKAEDD